MAERESAAGKMSDPVVATVVENLGREARRLVVTA
jgi:hypothetical protein